MPFHKLLPPVHDSFACLILCILKLMLLTFIFCLLVFIPMGSYTPSNRQLKPMRDSRYYTKETLCAFCDFCDAVAKIARDFFDFAEKTTNVVLDYLYIGKLKFYSFLARVDHRDLCKQSRCCEVDSDGWVTPKTDGCNYCRKKR